MAGKYGLKLKDTWGDYKWLYTWNEYTAFSPSRPLSFNSIAEAEEYAQAHEIPNFIIEPVAEVSNVPEGKRLLNG